MDHGNNPREEEDKIRTAVVSSQLKWIEDHGGDLEGYGRTYSDIPRANADAIYYADVNHLRFLRGESWDVIDRDNAVRILGEDYFA